MPNPTLPAPLTQLGELSTEEFIRNYWQQKPLLVRQAIPNFDSPLSPDELAGLALEDDVESRLILEHGKHPWELRRGPFGEDSFSALPADHWTLLIQAADQLVPEVADLLERFRFIPSWRLDDIMISYATKGGSVGPHYDQYDVFLLQAGGQRHWQIGQHCSHRTPRRDDTELHILKDFELQQEFVLEPGDMLYLPPQLAHWGKALDNDCITYSIGFRAPSKAEILEELLQEALSRLTEDDRFEDPAFSPQTHAGEISLEARQQIETIWQQAITPSIVEDWFGRYMTTPKYGPNEEAEELTEPSRWDSQDQFRRHPASRFAYTLNHDSPSQAHLFVDNCRYNVSATMAQLVANRTEFSGVEVIDAMRDRHDAEVFQTLVNQQSIEFE